LILKLLPEVISKPSGGKVEAVICRVNRATNPVLKQSLAMIWSGMVWSLLCTLAAAQALADDASPNEVALPPEIVKLQQHIAKTADWNQLALDRTPDEVMKPHVALLWSNNVRGSATGATVLYLADGIPQAVACIYPWEGKLNHDLDSMSTELLTARRDNQVIWHPKEPGVEYQSVTDVQAPSDKPLSRLRQMKAIASHYECTMLGWKLDKTDREPLRLLPQPIYRYPENHSRCLDGAVFAFVLGTDPEILLMVEAVQKPGDDFTWQVAFCRRTSGELEAKLNDQIVWHAHAHPPFNDPKQIHFVIASPLPPEINP
jgi:hypothetical protein